MFVLNLIISAMQHKYDKNQCLVDNADSGNEWTNKQINNA